MIIEPYKTYYITAYIVRGRGFANVDFRVTAPNRDSAIKCAEVRLGSSGRCDYGINSIERLKP